MAVKKAVKCRRHKQHLRALLHSHLLATLTRIRLNDLLPPIREVQACIKAQIYPQILLKRQTLGAVKNNMKKMKGEQDT